MKRSLLILLALAAMALLSGYSRFPRQPYIFHHENVLGTSMELKVLSKSAEQAARAESAALAEIDRLSKILSSYNPESEFSHWFSTRNEAVPVSSELIEVLGLFDRWRLRTGGALDASAEAVTQVWKKAARQGRLPSAGEQLSAATDARQVHWSLDNIGGTAAHLSSTPLAMNSFTKSYIVQKAAEAALFHGAAGVVVNIGGDIAVRGEMTESVGVVNPQADEKGGLPIAQLQIADRAVATSGGYRRGFDIGGRHYSHIVDPRSGATTGHVLSATVVAPVATDAGALATAFAVLSIDESERLARATPGAEYLIVAANGSVRHSAGWPALLAAAPQSSVGKPGPIELTINLELPLIQDQRYRRPFLAVWVEDKDKFPVRTIALWFNKSRWLPDLKGWYRADRMRGLAEGTDITTTLSSATRPPGKYTLKWDGKDNVGKSVQPGKYTVYIEAAREHGTYQTMRQELDIPGASKQYELPGGTEISAVTLDYRKAAR